MKKLTEDSDEALTFCVTVNAAAILLTVAINAIEDIPGNVFDDVRDAAIDVRDSIVATFGEVKGEYVEIGDE